MSHTASERYTRTRMGTGWRRWGLILVYPRIFWFLLDHLWFWNLKVEVNYQAATLSGPNEFAEFCARLEQIKDFYRRHPGEVRLNSTSDFNPLFWIYCSCSCCSYSGSWSFSCCCSCSFSCSCPDLCPDVCRVCGTEEDQRESCRQDKQPREGIWEVGIQTLNPETCKTFCVFLSSWTGRSVTTSS